MKMRKHLRSGLLILVALALVTLVSLSGISAGALYFQEDVKIPFALQSRGKVVKAGKYLLTIRSESGRPVLTLQPDDTGTVLVRTEGERTRVPENARDYEGTRLRILPVPDRKSPGKRWIVFTLDYRDVAGIHRRWRFKLREAVGKE